MKKEGIKMKEIVIQKITWEELWELRNKKHFNNLDHTIGYLINYYYKKGGE